MKKTTSIILLLALALAARAELVINEIMQSNIDCVMDELNDYPDSWVEVYNNGDAEVNLQNYKISPTRNHTDGYRLKDQAVAPHSFALIYCDKEATQQHTNFRLESGNNASVFLFNNHTPIDSITGLQKQPSPNIAYGRQTDGGSTWGYQAVSTPGAANCGTVYQQCLPDPVFSVTGRVFTQQGSVSLGIIAPQGAPAGTVVRYTTDGTEPTAESPVLDGTLRFSNTKLVKARLFCPGYLSPRSVTQSYIFLNRAMNLPVISIVANEADLYDSRRGILVEGNYSNDKKNYEYNWRRPINLELFETADSASVLNQLCETRIAGAASRGCALKSMALYANKRFGQKRFRYEFFPEDRPGETNYKSVVLRNAGNDFDYLYMRDAIIQRSIGHYADVDWQAYRPAIVFINGTYKGILNIRERANEDNVFTNYDELEDITMMENTWNLQAGSWETWNEFINFCHTKGHTWAEYNRMMDCVEYINVMICELFFMNQDFPGNNIVYWRPNTAQDGLPAKWRLLIKDTDFGLGLYGGKYEASFNMMAWMYNPDYDPDRTWANTWEHTRMFRYAMQNADFQREFCDRAAIYMGDFLNYERIWADIWQKMYNDIHIEYRSYHRPLFNQWWPSYPNELANAKLWLKQRPEYFARHVAEQFGLGAPTTMLINQDPQLTDTTGLRVIFNDVELTRPVWDGLFYQGREIRLSAESTAAHTVVRGWEVKYTDEWGKIKAETKPGASITLTIPEGSRKLIVNALTGTGTSLDQIDTAEQERPADAHKFIHEGHLYIERDGKIYDILGNKL